MEAALYSDPAAPELTTPEGVQRHELDGMGTRITVLAPDEWQPAAGRAVHRLFVEWEHALSRFLPDNELSYVNAHAGEHLVVSRLFWHVLTAALDAARATDGIYDPTMLHQLAAAGYDRSFDRLPRTQPAPSASPSPGGAWRSVQLDHDERAVTLPPGIALDFGGIAKGMAVDAALDRLVEMGLPYAAVEAGGDMRVHGRPERQDGWPVAIERPGGHETVTLYEGALATSSLSRRRWRQGDVVRHHILDPRTGEPAHSGVWSVSVAASLCAQADVAAKTAFILGPDAGRRFLDLHGLSALMQMEDGAVHIFGRWPSPSGGDAP